MEKYNFSYRVSKMWLVKSHDNNILKILCLVNSSQVFSSQNYYFNISSKQVEVPWNLSNFNFLGFLTLLTVNPSTERFPALSATWNLISFTLLKLQKTLSDLLSNTLVSASQLLLYSLHNFSSRISHNVSFQPLNLNVATYNYLRLMSSFLQ